MVKSMGVRQGGGTCLLLQLVGALRRGALRLHVDAVLSERRPRCCCLLLRHVGAPAVEIGVAQAPLIECAARTQLTHFLL